MVPLSVVIAEGALSRAALGGVPSMNTCVAHSLFDLT